MKIFLWWLLFSALWLLVFFLFWAWVAADAYWPLDLWDWRIQGDYSGLEGLCRFVVACVVLGGEVVCVMAAEDMHGTPVPYREPTNDRTRGEFPKDCTREPAHDGPCTGYQRDDCPQQARTA